MPLKKITVLWLTAYAVCISFFLGVFPTVTIAQDTAGIENIVSKVKDQNAVTNIYYIQDAIWICTEGGVLKYDTNVTVYRKKDGLADDLVTSMTQDDSGRLWFGTQNGVSVFDGTWKTYRSKDGLPSDIVYDIAAGPEGSIWVGTHSGLGMFDGKRWVKLGFGEDMLTPAVNRIVKSPAAALWVGTYAMGIGIIEGTGINIIDDASGLPSNLVTAVAFDNDGNAWVGTARGLSLLSGGKVKKTFSVKNGLVSNEVTAIAVDAKGNVWAGFWGGGVGVYDGKAWRFLSTEDGILDDRVTALAVDPQGTVWIGCWGGISKVTP
jgi:ligand-binding sensor domain-containing protein